MRTTPLDLSPGDDSCHEADGHPGWQESCALVWFDAERAVAGYQHLYLRPADDLAVLWGWHLDESGVSASSGPRVAPRPADDLTDLTVLDWRIVTTEALRAYESTASYGTTVARVAYRADRSPVAFTVPDLDSGLDQRHYESVGRIDGTYVDAAARDVAGVAFHDHSWGVRSRPTAGPVSHHFGFGRSDAGHFVINRTGLGPSSWDHSYLVLGETMEPIVDITGLDGLLDSPAARVVLHTEGGEHEVVCERLLDTEVVYGDAYGARCAFFAGTLDGVACVGMVEVGG